jgi:aminopeptidase N
MNLTRDEVRDRARIVSVSAYEIDIDVTTGPTTFASTTVARFSAAAGATSWIDLVAPEVREIVLNGRTLDPAEVFDGARIVLADLAADNELRVVADCAYMNTGEGLHRFVDPVDGEVYLYSQFEVADSRRVFAVFEQPDLKATFALTVTAPAEWQVVSVSPTPHPSRSARAWPGGVRADAGALVVRHRAGRRPVPRRARRGRARRAPDPARGVLPTLAGSAPRRRRRVRGDAPGLRVLRAGVRLPVPVREVRPALRARSSTPGRWRTPAASRSSRTTSSAPASPTPFVERRAETILHELAHMWFGDLVTMQWWDDLWLNESFATYASVVCQAEVTRGPRRGRPSPTPRRPGPTAGPALLDPPDRR